MNRPDAFCDCDQQKRRHPGGIGVGQHVRGVASRERRREEEERFGYQSASDPFEACRLEERREVGIQVGVSPVGARRQGGEERGSCINRRQARARRAAWRRERGEVLDSVFIGGSLSPAKGIVRAGLNLA